MESYLNRAFPSGVLGMAGNMWRWCSSLHEPGFSIGELGSRIARRVPSIASQSWAEACRQNRYSLFEMSDAAPGSIAQWQG